MNAPDITIRELGVLSHSNQERSAFLTAAIRQADLTVDDVPAFLRAIVSSILRRQNGAQASIELDACRVLDDASDEIESMCMPEVAL